MLLFFFKEKNILEKVLIECFQDSQNSNVFEEKPDILMSLCFQVFFCFFNVPLNDIFGEILVVVLIVDSFFFFFLGLI